MFIPTWYPDEENPAAGVFIREHAKAAALHNEVLVLQVNSARLGHAAPSVSETTEDGIRVRRLRYRTWRLVDAAQKWISEMATLLDSSRSAVGHAFGKLLELADLSIRGAWSLALCLRTMHECGRLYRASWWPDVIHAHVYGAGVPAVLTGAIRSTPVVVSEHLGDLAYGRLNLIETLKARLVARRADMVLPVSDILGDALRRLGAQRIEVIPNVIEPGCRDIAAVGTHDPVEIVAVTSPWTTKAVDVLLEAIAMVAELRRDFRVTVVGVTAEDVCGMAPEAGRLVRDGTVTVLGRVDKQEVLDLLCRSDFLVHSTVSESFGLVVYEAVACGRPFVATDIDAFRGLGSTGAGLLVAPGDAKALADGITRMLDRYTEYDVSALAAEIADRYSYEAVGRSLDEIYRKVTRG